MEAPRVAIVTGASRGIGRATAEGLARAGFDLALAARGAADLEAVADAIRTETGRRVVVHAADLRDPAAPAALAEAAVATFGRIDLVVNNAGATKRGPFLELTDADWDDGFALKFFGAVRLARAAWPHLRATKGQVINIAGTAGHLAYGEFTIGGAVNAGIDNLTKALADFGLRDGIRVNGISPGQIRTGRLDARIRKYADKHGLSFDDAAAQMSQRSHAIRFGEPEEVAAVVVFLAAGGGTYLNGALIDVDGGLTQGL
ncbi:MAG: SDR family oxidoreductase [Rhodospirillaceae bacterium]